MGGLEFNLTDFEKQISEKIKKVSDLKSILEDIGIAMIAAANECFEKEKDPEGNDWVPWSVETIRRYQRMEKPKDGNKKLQFNGDLRKRVGSRFYIKKNSVSIGVGGNIKYGRIHQLGQYEAGKRSPKMGRLGIPARPYLGFSPRLKEKIRMIVREHLAKM